MSIKKERAIKDILESINQFSTLILVQLDQLQKVVESKDAFFTEEQLKEFNKREKEFDKLEVKVSDQIINTIVLHQPVASDLRLLISCYRISINLERIGDQTMNIVNFMKKINDKTVLNLLPGVLDKILSSSINMVRKSILSFSNNDKEYALWTLRIDSEIDDMNDNLMKQTLEESNIDSETRKLMLGFIQLNGIISDIERIADHATNIAESAIYAIEGIDLRHKKYPGN